MALTAEQIALIRAFTGDSSTDTPVFSDPELQTFATLAASEHPDLNVINVVTVYVLRGLLSNRTKFSDYVQNESQENESQVFRQLLRTLEKWEGIAGMTGGILFLGQIDLGISASEDGVTEWEDSWYA